LPKHRDRNTLSTVIRKAEKAQATVKKGKAVASEGCLTDRHHDRKTDLKGDRGERKKYFLLEKNKGHQRRKNAKKER